MSVKIKFLNEGVIATFKGNIEENEIRDTFIDIIEKVSIKKITYFLFDFTDITSYTIPPNYMNIVKMITHFSVSYNENIKGIIVATHPSITSVVSKIIKNQEELKWEYFLFDKLSEAQKLINTL
ncbi:MAG: hypothetical protein PSN34_04925 [Urechidicola sp.]|nr:hypothetical protein [Urechidicola sp.]